LETPSAKLHLDVKKRSASRAHALADHTVLGRGLKAGYETTSEKLYAEIFEINM
jgi:hypothetical protein